MMRMQHLSSFALFSMLLTLTFLIGQVNALSLDGLMADTQENTSEAPKTAPTTLKDTITEPSASDISIGSMMSGTSDNQEGGLSLDDIYQGRERHQLNTAREQLASLNQQIGSSCRCALSPSNACFDLNTRSLKLTQQSVIEAADEANQILTEQSKTICESWNNSKNFESDDPKAMQQQVAITQRYQHLLDQVDKASEDTAAKLTKQNQDIEAAIAKQEQSSGFDWGKAMAMGVGAIAGGLGQLDLDSQTKIVSSIIQDSYSGDSSMNNLQSTVNDLNAQMKQVSSGNSGSGSNGSTSSSQSQSFSIDYVYRDTCPPPSSTQIHAPIKTNIQACANAMERYAKAASCNLVDDLEAAQNDYYSACASEMYQ